MPVLIIGVVLTIVAFIVTLAQAQPSLDLTTEERNWLDNNPEKLTLYFNTEFPPIEFISESGDFVGMGADIIAMVEKRLGITFLKQPCKDWNAHLAALENGECAIAPTIVHTVERGRYALFTTPYATVPVVIITSRSFSGNLTLDDLAGRRVGVVSGYATEQYVRDRSLDRFEVVPVQNVSEGLRRVSFGQLDALVENLAVAAYTITQEGLPNLRVAGRTDYAFAWSIGVSRKYPLLYSAIQKALYWIPETELAAARNRWIALEGHLGIDPETLHILKISALFVLSLLLSLSCITFFLKRRLNEKVVGLRESELRYRELVENANSIILRMDAKGTITFFNEFAQRFFGFTQNEIIGKNVVGTIAPDTNDKNPEAFQRRLMQNPELYAVHENIRKDGSRCWVAWTNKVISNAQGQCTDILCIGSDVTESRNAADRLSQALKDTELERERFRTLVNNAPFGMVLVGKDGDFLLMNPQFRELSGYDETSVLTGREWFRKAFPDPEYRHMVIACWIDDMNISKLGETRPRIFTMTCKSGEKKIINFIPVELTNGDQLVTMVDITRNLEIEDRLRQTERLESVGRLAAGVAHDLNNLLSPILGNAELMLLDVDANNKNYRRIQGIKQAAERSRDLIQQLLAFGRKQMLEVRVLDLRRVVGDMEKLIKRTIRENIELNTFMCPEPCPVLADAGQIGQILMNLCVNSQDAMPNGGNLSIEVKHVLLDENAGKEQASDTGGNYVMLAVSDTGTGMSREIQQHIFEPFFTTKNEMGTGLGLATVYGIVKQHGGIIWVYSEPDKGTTFKVYLPAIESEISVEEKSFPENKDLRGSETVLVVEDNEMAREVAGSILKQLGYKVLTATCGDDALNLLLHYSEPVNLLLTDVVMPNMDGKTLVAEISQICPDIRVLYMSGYTQNVIAHHGVMDEGVYFIQKPFSIRDLALKVRVALDNTNNSTPD